MTVEQLIIDDSFINYCFRKKAEDIEYWESYIEKNPVEIVAISEASSFVLGLSDVLQHLENPDAAKEPFEYKLPDKIRKKQKGGFSVIFKNRQNIWWFAASVIFLLTIGLSYSYFFSGKKVFPDAIAIKKTFNSDNSRELNVDDDLTTYQTGTGEQKTIWLSDKTKIIMNASSKLTVSKDFGNSNRMVFLEGEALFDVTHNEAVPFMVEAKDFTVKVLGTKFNIRSYSTDKQSEAALLRGKIELMMKNTPDEQMVLRPLQKVVVSNNKIISSSLVSGRNNKKIPDILASPSFSENIEESLIETSWIYNRLEIVDQSFDDFATSLERRFGVTIKFQDDFVKKYKYTAVFEKENIDQVLSALSGSLPFNYERKENVIIIKK